ncbi:MAG TPA: glycosyltransferase family 4 protein [Acidimicrobiales bacterium]|nr:glycosyltransferase family 4 protein [Acidimicrobiales bacterium]
MRVLALSNLYPPHALGGYEWSAHDVLRRLHERGHDVEVLTTETRLPEVADGEVAPFPVHRILGWYWDDHELTSPHPVRRLALERRNLRALRAALDRHRPDVVSVWNMGALSHGLLRAVADRGVPMVYAVCDEWPVYGPHLDAWGRIFRHRPALARVAEAALRVPCRPTDLGPTGAWCFVSSHTRDACIAGSPYTFPRATVVHSGIEADDFPLTEPDHERPFAWRLLYVGRLDVRKGVLTAVDALAQLPDEATLTLVGRGDAAEAVAARARQHGVADRVTVRSAERAALATAYRDADVLLFTSEWAEPFGLTPIEAMACGTPVVGTGTGGSAGFLLDGRTCLRYPPGDAVALAAAVRRLAGDPTLRARLRQGGRAVAAELTTERLADTFEAWHAAAADGFAHGIPPERPLLAADHAAR